MKPEYITEYATATWLLGHREQSIEVCKAGLSVNPRKAAWNRIAFYDYTDLKKTDEALAYADKLFNASDSAHFIAEDYTYHGTALLQAKRWDDAIHALRRLWSLMRATISRRASSTRTSLTSICRRVISIMPSLI